MAPPIDTQIARIARRQHGLISRQQIRRLGGSSHFIARRLGNGTFVHEAPGVVALPGAVPTWRRSVMAAVLSCGDTAVASHHTAALLHGLTNRRPPNIEVTTPGSHAFDRAWTCHRTAALEPQFVWNVDSIRVTSPCLTILQCSGASPGTSAGLADAGARRGVVDVAGLDVVLAAMEGRRIPGLAEVREVARLRRKWEGTTESEIEDQFRRLVAADGIEGLTPQYEIRRPDGTLITRADFAAVEAKASVHLDGFAWHSDIGAFDRDRSNQNELAALGWSSYRYTARHLDESPGVILEQMRAVVRRVA